MVTSELTPLYPVSSTSSSKIAHKGTLNFLAHSQNSEKQLLASSCLSVRPSARMEQLGFHWIAFVNFTLVDFSKIRRENSTFVKI
jgi:hypothetical protein